MNRLEDLETRLPEKPKKGGTKEPEARMPQATATASASTKKSLKPGSKKKSTRPEVEDEVSPGPSWNVPKRSRRSTFVHNLDRA